MADTRVTRAALFFWFVAEAPSETDMRALFAAVAANDEAAIRALIVACNGPTTDERWEEALASV